MTHFWHPFADMSQVDGHELVLVRGDRCWVWDRNGRAFLDATAGLWHCAVGYGRDELADVAAEQLRALPTYSTFGSLANEPARSLADRLAALAPVSGEPGVFFTLGGSDAIDTAAKLARRYWQVEGESERQLIVARGGAYHGMNAFGTSLAGIAANAAGYGRLVPEVLHATRDSADEVAEIFERERGRVAAFVGEPVQGAAGVHPPGPTYWSQVQGLCREHDVLLIADEVVTGFGRLGDWFASPRFGLTPDLIVCAKGLTSGYLPLGAVIAGDRVKEKLWREGGVLRHGYTYSGHAAACAVALANLAIIEREQLCDRVTELEPALARATGRLAEHELVEEVRTIGLLAGIELAATAIARRPDLVELAVSVARQNGLLVRGLVGTTLQISPSLVIGEEEIESIAVRIETALDEVSRRLARERVESVAR